MTPEEIEAFISRIDLSDLDEEDRDLIKGMLRSFTWLSMALEEKTISIKRLQRLFGFTSERSSKLFENDEADPDTPSDAKEEGTGQASGDQGNTGEKKKKPGHGRNGADAYTGAERVVVPHPSLKAGDRCPECENGNLYRLPDPGYIIHCTGAPPVQATVFELEKFRCASCGAVFTAPPPPEAGDKKYDETAGAMITLLKYGSGMPFYRLGNLQKFLGIPLPPSTQWEIVEGVANETYPVFLELKNIAAQGDVIHNDDTTARILSRMKQIDENDRTGTFTTGILSKIPEHDIALYFTSGKHAGENLNELLKQREGEKSAPIQMCDALARNLPKEFKTVLANCLTHGRRRFVDLLEIFPEECRYIIKTLGKVYEHDEVCRKEGMTPEDRLAYHQKHSAPLMDKLYEWMNDQFEEKTVEPNSSLGKAINYFIKHRPALSLFLNVPGAPLDKSYASYCTS